MSERNEAGAEESQAERALEARIQARNDAAWAEAKAFGEREGFGFMIQVAAAEWVKYPHMDAHAMAEWLRSFADDMDKPRTKKRP